MANPLTFTRASIAYNPDGTSVAINTPRFSNGHSGKALLMEGATTNLFLNPSCATVTDWSPSNSATMAAVTLASAGLPALPGFTSCLRLTANASGQGHITPSVHLALTPNTKYTISSWVYIPSAIPAGYAVMSAWYNNAAWYSITNSLITERNQWVRKTLTFTTNATYGSTVCGILGYNTGAGASAVSYVCGAQVELKPHPTTYYPGTRSADACTLPLPTMGNSGTFSCWVNIPSVGTGIMHGIANNGSYAATGWYLWTTGSYVEFIIGNGTVGVYLHHPTAPTVGWHHIAVTWTPTSASIYWDNVAYTVAGTYAPVFLSTLTIAGGGADRPLDSYIEDIRIADRALTAAEIALIYSDTL